MRVNTRARASNYIDRSNAQQATKLYTDTIRSWIRSHNSHAGSACYAKQAARVNKISTQKDRLAEEKSPQRHRQLL